MPHFCHSRCALQRSWIVVLNLACGSSGSTCVMIAEAATTTSKLHMNASTISARNDDAAARFTLTLKCINAPALAVQTTPSATIEQLLLQVAQLYGYAPDQVMVMKGGQVLRAESRLLDCPAVIESKEAYLLHRRLAKQPKQILHMKAAVGPKGPAPRKQQLQQLPQQQPQLMMQKTCQPASQRCAPSNAVANGFGSQPASTPTSFSFGAPTTMQQQQKMSKLQQYKMAVASTQKQPQRQPPSSAATSAVEATLDKKFDDVDAAQLQDELCDRTVQVVRAALRRVITLPVRGDWPVRWVVAKLARIENTSASRIHLLCQNSVLQHENALHEYDGLVAVAGRIHMLVSDSWLPPFVVQAKICPPRPQLQHQPVQAKRAKRAKTVQK